GQQRQRMAPGSLSARFVKLVETAGALRVGTDVVERDEAAVAVEGRVLHPLGHHRARHLLNPPAQLAGRRGESAKPTLIAAAGLPRPPPRDRNRALVIDRQWSTGSRIDSILRHPRHELDALDPRILDSGGAGA